MAQSREQLTMDLSKESNNSMFKRPRGCFLSQGKALSLFLLTCLALIAVGVVTYHYAPCHDNPFSPLNQAGDGEVADKLSAKVTDVRLPRNVKPIYYKIDLIPYIDPAKNFTIDGKVTFYFEGK